MKRRINMYLCIALLVDYKVNNYVREIVYNLSENQGVGIEPSLLPQHVSLKQTFEVDSIKEVDRFFEDFAASVKTFEVEFSKIDLIKMGAGEKTTEILWLDVEESNELRVIHNRLNDEMAKQVNVPATGFDGDRFHFHSTIAYGYNGEVDFESVKEEWEPLTPELRFEAKEIALFYSPDAQCVPGRFVTYKILPLGI